MIGERALVTGATGFIGTRVVRALGLAGYDVGRAGTGFRTDPLSLAALAPSFDDSLALVVHCAGGSSVGSSLAHPLLDFEKTVAPLATILELMRTQAPGARLVLLSSAAVYGNAARVPTPEDTPCAPISPYGVHKHLSESLCASWGRSFGVSTVILRLFSVYGAGLRKQLLWDACGKARSGDVRFSGTGREVRDWLHVDDAVSLILATVGAASPAAPSFNGATGRGVTVEEVLRQVCDEMAAPPPVFDGHVRAGDPARYVGEVSRARSLGWEPRVPLSQGVSDYVAWFREQP